jgi:putative transposase
MDAALIVTIRAAHGASKGTGAPRLQVDLADACIRVGRKRVARLMLSAGLAGVSRRRNTVITTVRDGARQAPDLVDRDVTAERPNMLWVADITYIPTWPASSIRRIVGCSMATTLHTQVVLTLSTWRSGSGGRAA